MDIPSGWGADRSQSFTNTILEAVLSVVYIQLTNYPIRKCDVLATTNALIKVVKVTLARNSLHSGCTVFHNKTFIYTHYVGLAPLIAVLL